MSSCPLVTFAVLCYNQERFVREAVEGAFAQTYSPLEIILTDDCSNDRTFTIIEEMTAAYKGPHKITLNRNRKNIGIGNHVNLIFERCRTDFIVMAAGDDISDPERTSVLMQAVAHNPKAVGGGSAYISIDERGRELERNDVRNGFRCLDEDDDLRVITGRQIKGATAIWNRKVYDSFGPIREPVIYEDVVFTIRALVLGEVFLLIDKPLVKYRTAGLTSNRFELNPWKRERQVRSLFENLDHAAEFLECDMQGVITESTIPSRIVDHIKRDRAILNLCQNWWKQGVSSRRKYCSQDEFSDLPPYFQKWMLARTGYRWVFYLNAFACSGVLLLKFFVKKVIFWPWFK